MGSEEVGRYSIFILSNFYNALKDMFLNKLLVSEKYFLYIYIYTKIPAVSGDEYFVLFLEPLP